MLHLFKRSLYVKVGSNGFTVNVDFIQSKAFLPCFLTVAEAEIELNNNEINLQYNYKFDILFLILINENALLIIKNRYLITYNRNGELL